MSGAKSCKDQSDCDGLCLFGKCLEVPQCENGVPAGWGTVPLGPTNDSCCLGKPCGPHVTSCGVALTSSERCVLKDGQESCLCDLGSQCDSHLDCGTGNVCARGKCVDPPVCAGGPNFIGDLVDDLSQLKYPDDPLSVCCIGGDCTANELCGSKTYPVKGMEPYLFPSCILKSGQKSCLCDPSGSTQTYDPKGTQSVAKVVLTQYAAGGGPPVSNASYQCEPSSLLGGTSNDTPSCVWVKTSDTACDCDTDCPIDCNTECPDLHGG